MPKKEKASNFLILTTAVKVAFLIGLIIGVPYTLMLIFQRYENKAIGVVDQQNAVVSQFTTDSTSNNSPSSDSSNGKIKVLTQEQADTLNKIRDILQGNWVSEQDGRYKLNIDSTSKFTEYYDNNKEGYGIWKVLPQTVLNNKEMQSVDTSLAPTSVSDTQNSDNTIYIFQKEQYEPDHIGEIYLYQIQALDDKKFVIMFNGVKTDNGQPRQPLVFVKQ